jgi:hypothetical protein
MYILIKKYIFYVYITARKQAYTLRRGVLSKSLSMYIQEQRRKEVYNRKQAYILSIYKSKEGTKHTTARKYTIGSKYTYSLYIRVRKEPSIQQEAYIFSLFIQQEVSIYTFYVYILISKYILSVYITVRKELSIQ